MTTEACSNCGERGHLSDKCDTLNSMRIYLSAFNTESEICQEIENMTILRKYVENESKIINILKYVYYVDKNNNFEKILIAPNVIDVLELYDINDIYDKSQRSFLYNMHNIPEYLKKYTNGLIELHPNNEIENIYKIYVTRTKRERELYKKLENNDIYCTYTEARDELNKRIEFLYKKYATEI
jgi:hypothetical protein